MAKRSSTTKTRKSTKSSPKSSSKKAAGTKTRTAKKKSSKTKTGEAEVKIDRRRKERRSSEEEESKDPAPKLERRKKVNRRRQIDPTTCERDYSEQEVEFMNALDEYKRNNGRMFPTCSEVLEVIRGLGYVQLSPAELAVRQASEGDPQAELAGTEPESEAIETNEEEAEFAFAGDSDF